MIYLKVLRKIKLNDLKKFSLYTKVELIALNAR